MSQPAVLAVLAAIWAAVLVPVVRRRRPVVLPPVDPGGILEIPRRYPRAVVLPGLVLTVGGALVGAVLADGVLTRLELAGAGVFLALAALPSVPAIVAGTPYLRIDPSGVEVALSGRLAWHQVDGVVAYRLGARFRWALVSAHRSVPRPPGIHRLFRSLDAACVGHPVWSGLPVAGARPELVAQVLATLEAHGVPVLEPRPGGLRRCARLVLGFLTP
ncbi:MAG TPA: hypothetical protein VFJ85_07825 [Acidimicrobiales bacterium]|nr:hypothetical protein [Acidimicrobiales bacterium]